MLNKTEWVMIDLLNPQALLKALLSVWSRYTREGKKPGAERWIFDDIEYGPQMFKDVRDEWRKIVNARGELADDPSCFPYSMTFIRRAFLGVRKFNDEKKRDLCKAFNVELPPDTKANSDGESIESESTESTLF